MGPMATCVSDLLMVFSNSGDLWDGTEQYLIANMKMEDISMGKYMITRTKRKD